MRDFSLSGLENHAADPHQEFPGVTPARVQFVVATRTRNYPFTKQEMKKTKKKKINTHAKYIPVTGR